MNPIIALLGAIALRVSPQILKAVLPIVAGVSKDVWSAAYPIAIDIVKDLADNGQLDGLDKHKAAVLELEKRIGVDARFAKAELTKAHLGQIVLAAFFDTIQGK